MVVWLVAEYEATTYPPITNFNTRTNAEHSRKTAINYTTCYRLPFINRIINFKYQNNGNRN